MVTQEVNKYIYTYENPQFLNKYYHIMKNINIPATKYKDHILHRYTTYT